MSQERTTASADGCITDELLERYNVLFSDISGIVTAENRRIKIDQFMVLL